jgi:hypothetical protein
MPLNLRKRPQYNLFWLIHGTSSSNILTSICEKGEEKGEEDYHNLLFSSTIYWRLYVCLKEQRWNLPSLTTPICIHIGFWEVIEQYYGSFSSSLCSVLEHGSLSLNIVLVEFDGGTCIWTTMNMNFSTYHYHHPNNWLILERCYEL